MHLLLKNVPAAFFACEDAAHGDPCRMPGGIEGTLCTRDTLCTVDMGVDEPDKCLICTPPCYGREPEEACIQPSGEAGVCVALTEDCTDKPETSFAECNRCVEGQVPRVDAESGGCDVSPGVVAGATLPWALLLVVALRQLRR